MVNPTIPKEVKDDSIIEALCEIRFNTNELAEIVVGRLSDHKLWRGFNKNRLPVADIPGPIRAVDETLRYQPVLELRNTDGTHLVKIGSNVLSYHNVGKYCGWPVFEPALREAIDALFSAVSDVQVHRLGFRYVNAITSTRHHIGGVKDLELKIEVASRNVDGPINLNFLTASDTEHLTMTRIASPEFVQGGLPADTTVVVDVDVFTPGKYLAKDMDSVVSWTRDAHELEKSAFFALIPLPVLSRWIER